MQKVGKVILRAYGKRIENKPAQNKINKGQQKRQQRRRAEIAVEKAGGKRRNQCRGKH